MGYYCDYEEYEYEYEREPYESEQHELEFDVEEGFFNVVVHVNIYCIRKGTYSSRATDPDEYFGEYSTEYEILSAEKYNDELEDFVEFDVDKLPEVVYSRIEYEFGE